MNSPAAPKDTIDQCVRQLLELNEKRPVAQLAWPSVDAQAAKLSAGEGSGAYSAMWAQSSPDELAKRVEAITASLVAHGAIASKSDSKPVYVSSTTYPGSTDSSSFTAESNSPAHAASHNSGSEGSETNCFGQPSSSQLPMPPGLTPMFIASADAEAATFQAPLGLPMKVNTSSATDRLDHATEVLQAALKHWESCFESTEAQARTHQFPPAASMAAVMPRLMQMEGTGLEAAMEHWETSLLSGGHSPVKASASPGQGVASPPEKRAPINQKLDSLLQAHPPPWQPIQTPAASLQSRVMPKRGGDGLREKVSRDLASALPAGVSEAAADSASVIASSLAVSALMAQKAGQQKAQAIQMLGQQFERHEMGKQQAPHASKPLMLAPWLMPSPGPSVNAAWPPTPCAPSSLATEELPRYLPHAYAPRGGGDEVSSAATRVAGGRRQKASAETDDSVPDSIRTHLQDLQKVPADRVVIVRKINKLGLESAEVLKNHYSRYGIVDRVLVAHSHVKSQNRRCGCRLRPSALGFVVMGTKEAKEAIVNDGPDQVIEGGGAPHAVTIRVANFERRTEGGTADADCWSLEHEQCLGG